MAWLLDDGLIVCSNYLIYSVCHADASNAMPFTICHFVRIFFTFHFGHRHATDTPSPAQAPEENWNNVNDRRRTEDSLNRRHFEHFQRKVFWLSDSSQSLFSNIFSSAVRSQSSPMDVWPWAIEMKERWSSRHADKHSVYIIICDLLGFFSSSPLSYRMLWLTEMSAFNWWKWTETTSHRV